MGLIMELWKLTIDVRLSIQRLPLEELLDSQRERHKQKNCKDDSINAIVSGGLTRSSDETSVMEAERRG